MSTSFSLCLLSFLFLSSTLAFGQIQRPNPNLRFCGNPKNEGYVPQKVCNTNFREMICVDFADGAPDPQFCSTGMCAIEAGEDGLAAIDSLIYRELTLVGYLYKSEEQSAEVVKEVRKAFNAWEAWKECVMKLYDITLKAKNKQQTSGLESPEIRATKEKLEDMVKLLPTIKLGLEKATDVGIEGKYLAALVSRALEILSVEETRFGQLQGFFGTLADGIEDCPP